MAYDGPRKIMCDIDEVLLDFMGAFLGYYNTRFGTRYRKRDIFNYNLELVFKHTKGDMASIVHDFYKSDFFRRIKPVSGSLEGIIYLRSNGYEICLLTSRHIEIQGETRESIEEHFKECFSGIEFTGESFNGDLARDKAEICLEKGFKILIDDRYENVRKCCGNGIMAVLFSRPWNNKVSLGERITRANGWQDIIRIF